jgi:hypothetical protein
MLVYPASCAVLSEEEMTYTSGGSTASFALAICADAIEIFNIYNRYVIYKQLREDYPDESFRALLYESKRVYQNETTYGKPLEYAQFGLSMTSLGLSLYEKFGPTIKAKLAAKAG